MDSKEAVYYNAVALACQGSYELMKKYWEAHASWEKSWAKLQPELTAKPADPERQYNELTKRGMKLILRADPEFPKLLMEIPWPPFALYLKGKPLKNDPAIAIVGTRKATTEGKSLSKKFALELASYGFTVVSGLAFGIDSAAHEGALSSGGATVAVLACGLDKIYPRSNESLAKKILAESGTLISEYPIGTPALKHHFIERNRLVSGLSRGAIIIEAPRASGSLATARFALEQNREVFVIPGTITHPNYAGSNELIKSGAALITGIDDVLLALNLAPGDQKLKLAEKALSAADLDENQKTVILRLKESAGRADIDALAKLTNLDTQSVNRAVSFLLIKGLIKEEAGKYYI